MTRKNDHVSAHFDDDDDAIRLARTAVALDLEKKRALNMPITAFDRKSQTVYTIGKDGLRVAMSGKMRKGRYSERIK